MNVQVFGTNKSQDTKKALRFFKERGVKPQFVDLQEVYMAHGEIGRFVQKFGVKALVDTNSRAYKDAGLEHMAVPDEGMIEKLLEDPKLMIQPLLRSGNTLGVGWDEKVWRAWHDESKK
ncbi:MAG: arsenate reductase family protein [Trueperaceae bacterium]